MRTRSSVIRASAGAVAFMACLAHVVESQQPPAGRMRAGAAKADITPKQSDLTIATDSIRDHLFARAIVVDDGSTCAVLVGMDLGGAPIRLSTTRRREPREQPAAGRRTSSSRRLTPTAPILRDWEAAAAGARPSPTPS